MQARDAGTKINGYVPTQPPLPPPFYIPYPLRLAALLPDTLSLHIRQTVCLSVKKLWNNACCCQFCVLEAYWAHNRAKCGVVMYKIRVKGCPAKETIEISIWRGNNALSASFPWLWRGNNSVQQNAPHLMQSVRMRKPLSLPLPNP